MRSYKPVVIVALIFGLPLLAAIVVAIVDPQPVEQEFAIQPDDLEEATPAAPPVRFEPAIVVDPDEFEGAPVALGAGPENRVVLVFALEDWTTRMDTTGGSYDALSHPPTPQDYRIVIYRDSVLERSFLIEDDPMSVDLVTLLPGHVLLGNSGWDVDGLDRSQPNGRLYRDDGTFVRPFPLGSSIESLQGGVDGSIWINYYEGGIDVNLPPNDGSGVVQLDSKGARLYAYEPVAGTHEIVDCYTGTLDTDGNYWFYYTEAYQLVRIRNGEVSWWDIPSEDVLWATVDFPHALFFEMRDDDEVYTIVELLDDRTVRTVREFTTVDSSGFGLYTGRVICRDGSLWFTDADAVYRIAIRDMVEGGERVEVSAEVR